MSADHDSKPLPPEPETPTWFTVLGAVLFLAVGLWWLASFQTPRPPAGDAAPSASASAAASASAKPAR